MGGLSARNEKMKDDSRLECLSDAPSAGDSAGRGDYGEALRSIYRRTVEESIPEEFIELLDKLR